MCVWREVIIWHATMQFRGSHYYNPCKALLQLSCWKNWQRLEIAFQNCLKRSISFDSIQLAFKEDRDIHCPVMATALPLSHKMLFDFVIGPFHPNSNIFLGTSSARNENLRPLLDTNIPLISGKYGLRHHFWPLEIGFLVRKSEKKGPNFLAHSKLHYFCRHGYLFAIY